MAGPNSVDLTRPQRSPSPSEHRLPPRSAGARRWPGCPRLSVLALTPGLAFAKTASALYKDARAPIADRVQDLLGADDARGEGRADDRALGDQGRRDGRRSPSIPRRPAPPIPTASARSRARRTSAAGPASARPRAAPRRAGGRPTTISPSTMPRSIGRWKRPGSASRSCTMRKRCTASWRRRRPAFRRRSRFPAASIPASSAASTA